jgi:hypothetical protein
MRILNRADVIGDGKNSVSRPPGEVVFAAVMAAGPMTRTTKAHGLTVTAGYLCGWVSILPVPVREQG